MYGWWVQLSESDAFDSCPVWHLSVSCLNGKAVTQLGGIAQLFPGPGVALVRKMQPCYIFI